MPKTNPETRCECQHKKDEKHNITKISTVAKTSSERTRAYRARQKALLNAQQQSLLKVQQISVTGDPFQHLTKKISGAAKSVTERVREYRARQKAFLRAERDIPIGPNNVRNFQRLLNVHGHTSVGHDIGNNDNDSKMDISFVKIEGFIEGNVEHSYGGFYADLQSSYSQFERDSDAHDVFRKKFLNDMFGYPCSVCDRLWFKTELKKAPTEREELLSVIIENYEESENYLLCNTCFQSIKNEKIPTVAKYNGFKYKQISESLPPLDLISERLVSPRIPFKQIRRLGHVDGHCGIYGEIINIPVNEDNMVKTLPRNIDDDQCINVHIKRKTTYDSSYLVGLVNEETIRAWLQYLVKTPLYVLYKIEIDENFFHSIHNDTLDIKREDISEAVPIEDSLTAQQQTLMWNDDEYLRIAPGEYKIPNSILFNKHAEELAFPSIYMGHFRTFRKGTQAKPSNIAASEIRRSDRRGVTPSHLLYAAMKIMRLRVCDSLAIAFRHVAKKTKITRKKVESDEYVNNCIESNMTFLRPIPNSVWHWSERKRDLFAMIRQLGMPTMFLSLSANETGWSNLLHLLYRLKNNGTVISSQALASLDHMSKATLVNEDAVTCVIYFNRLVNILLTILQMKRYNPFGEYRVINYFKRMDFQYRGSPHVQIFLWLDNVPSDPLGSDKQSAINMIDYLITASSTEASGFISLQNHKHTFTCYDGKINTNEPQHCRFNAPFMPCKYTTILAPMQKDHPAYDTYVQRYKEIKNNLENNDYKSIESFYQENRIYTDDHYFHILQAGISKPTVFIKRHPSEKWNVPYNPFILNITRSSTEMQFIIDEFSCAEYVVEYVNKNNRGISNLQRQILGIMKEKPEFDIIEISSRMSIDMLNTVELTTQEAAWYLLRQPMTKSSVPIAYICTVWPIDRQRIRKRRVLNELGTDENSTNIWKDDWFHEYEQRPKELEQLSLAIFVAHYFKNPQGEYIRRKKRRIIRYRNYDLASNFNEYKREMVTLHIPFRNEEIDILKESKFIKIYNDNEKDILECRDEFGSVLNINKIEEICQKLCRDYEEVDDDDIIHDAASTSQSNPGTS